MHQFNLVKESFIFDYAISQTIANVIVHYVKYFNSYYLVSTHNVFAICILLVIVYKIPTNILNVRKAEKPKIEIEKTSTKSNTTDDKNTINDNKTSSPKHSEHIKTEEKKSTFAKIRDTTYEIFQFICFSILILNLIHEYHSSKTDYNKNYHYFRLLEANLRLKVPTFNEILYLSDAQFTFIDMETVRTYNSIFFIKFISLFVILFLGRLLYIHRHQSKIEEKKLAKNQHQNDIDRVKNYLLEDFLEENHIKMNELSNYEIEFNKELELLKTLFNYDYELYKSKKVTSTDDDEDHEKINFLNDIEKLREQINKNDKRKNNKNSDNSKSNGDKILKNENPIKQKKEKLDKKSQPKKDADNTTKTFMSSAPLSPIIGIDAMFTIRPHYLYNILQLLFIFLITGLVMKIKYTLTPFLCLMSSTFPPKNWFPQKNSIIYWIVLCVLLLCGIVDPGLSNIKNQYKHEEYSNVHFEQLLKWIDLNTEQTAVFAGPIDVTSSILLVNRRPIVNHAHHELSDME